MKKMQPMQPIVKDLHGVLRFRENAIVRYLVDRLGEVFRESRSARLDVDQRAWPLEDREQFAELAGERPGKRQNALVRYIVDHASDVIHPGAPVIDPDTGRPYHQGKLDLDKIMRKRFSQEDREQFVQLMGYSIAGYHELSYVSDESAARASALARAIDPGARGGCRDAGCPIHGGPVDVDDKNLGGAK